MPNTTTRRHAGLVDRMAAMLGIDLEEKIMQGQLQTDTLDDAVLRCTGCTDPDGCEQWMAGRMARADTPPGMCRNADLFELLKRGKQV